MSTLLTTSEDLALFAELGTLRGEEHVDVVREAVLALPADTRSQALREYVAAQRPQPVTLAAAPAPVVEPDDDDTGEGAEDAGADMPLVEAAPQRAKLPTWNDTVNAPSGRPRIKRLRPGIIAAVDKRPWLKKGFFRVPNALADSGLLTAMSEPVLRAYLLASRHADAEGVCWFSYQTLAKTLGWQSRRDGILVVRRLIEAGLLRLIARGQRNGTANRYQLLPLNALDLGKARESLSRPLKGGGMGAHQGGGT